MSKGAIPPPSLLGRVAEMDAPFVLRLPLGRLRDNRIQGVPCLNFDTRPHSWWLASKPFKFLQMQLVGLFG